MDVIPSLRRLWQNLEQAYTHQMMLHIRPCSLKEHVKPPLKEILIVVRSCVSVTPRTALNQTSAMKLVMETHTVKYLKKFLRLYKVVFQTNRYRGKSQKCNGNIFFFVFAFRRSLTYRGQVFQFTWMMIRHYSWTFFFQTNDQEQQIRLAFIAFLTTNKCQKKNAKFRNSAVRDFTRLASGETRFYESYGLWASHSLMEAPANRNFSWLKFCGKKITAMETQLLSKSKQGET